MATEFQVAWGLEENLPESYEPGRLLVTTDTKTIQLDISGARILLGQNLNLQNGLGERSLQQSLDEENYWVSTNECVKNAFGETNAETMGIQYNSVILEDGTEEIHILGGAFGQSSMSEGGKSQALGARSHAEGNRTIAFDRRAHAEGNQTFAKGQHSHAEGNLTSALGNSSHSEGWKTVAANQYSHAEGYSTSAKADAAHAEGTGTKASSFGAHAEGKETTASGDASHAEGKATESSGAQSHAEGNSTIASGLYSHSEGIGSQAKGDGAHAEGQYTEASGKNSHAGGQSATASGELSFAHGIWVTADQPNQTVFGKFNKTDAEAAFIIGGGSSNEDKRNIFTIDKNGNAYSNNVSLLANYSLLKLDDYKLKTIQNWFDTEEAKQPQKKYCKDEWNKYWFIDIKAIDSNDSPFAIKQQYTLITALATRQVRERILSYNISDESWVVGDWLTTTDATTMPTATTSSLGAIQVGNGLNIDDNGILSATEASNLFSMPYVVVTKDGTKKSKGKIRVWAYNLKPLTTYKILLYTRSRRRGVHQGNWIPAKDIGYGELAGTHVSDIKPDPDDDTTWPTYEAIDTVTMPWFENNNGYITTEWVFTTLDNETTYNFEVSVIDHLIKPLLKPSYSYDETTQTITFDWSRCGIIGMRKSSIAPLLFQFKIQQNSTIYENYRYPSTLAVGINSKVLKKLNENASTPIKNITVNPDPESGGITSDQLYISIR